MNRITFLFVLIILANLFQILIATTPSLSQPRQNLAATSVGNLALFAGGYNGSTVSDRVDIYNYLSNNWTIASLSESRNYLAATSLGDLAIFAGGCNATNGYCGTGYFSDRVDIYNYLSNNWAIASLSQPRSYLGATSVGSLALFAGGYCCNSEASDRVDIYNYTSNTWNTPMPPPLSEPRHSLAATSVGNLAIFAGGCNVISNDCAGGYSDRVDIYNYASNTWSTATLSQPRYALVATSVGSLALFAGGYCSTGYSGQVDIYNYISNTWSTATLSQPRYGLAATSVGNLALFAGGQNISGFSERVDIYNYTSNTWSTATLSQPRGDLAATDVGSLALFGGGYKPPIMALVDIYNSTFNFWTPQTCEPGTYVNPEASVGSCSDCPEGTYSNVVNSQGCFNCSIGTYSNVTGTTQCQQCPNGTYCQDDGCITCDPCQAGTTSNGGAINCLPCPPGTYSLEGSPSCIKCPAGTASEATGATSSDTCQPCEVGLYSSAGSQYCSPCPEGTYSNVIRAASCPYCPEGTYSNVTGATQCQQCLSGTFCQSEGCASCTNCSAGTTSISGSSSCTTCPVGTYSLEGSPSCIACPAGTASKESPATSSASCEPCEPGFFSSSGASQCSPCQEGTYSNATEASYCFKCPAGTASDILGANSSSTCQPCEAGFYASEGASECVKCSKGTISEPGSSSCYKSEDASSGVSTSLKIGIAVIVIAFLLILIGIILALIRRSRKRHTGYIKLDQVDTSHWNVIEHIEIVGRLGGGLFGDVFSGIWNGTTDVALKKLKSRDHFEEFAKEADVLQSLNHPNIVRFLGIHTSENGSQYIVMEFMSKGSIDTLLIREEQSLTLIDLLAMAKDAAAGMLYLEQQKIVHRDLALRNLLAAPGEQEKYIVKVSDFGLSRQIKEEGFYLKLENTGIPVRWTAPEVLEKGVYTSKSDVWSFGIVLWELFSYGQLPYGAMNHAEVIQRVVGGYRLDCPDGCPEEIRRLMLQCWQHQPEDRPGFKEIYNKIFSIWNGIRIGGEIPVVPNTQQVNSNSGSQNYNNQELRVFTNNDSNYNTEDPQPPNYNNV